jgi:hypothetical protein
VATTAPFVPLDNSTDTAIPVITAVGATVGAVAGVGIVAGVVAWQMGMLPALAALF